MAFIDAMRNDPADVDPQDQIEDLQSKLQDAYQRFERVRKYTSHQAGCVYYPVNRKINSLKVQVCSCGLLDLLK
jgi:hypothetical protein